jgi:hypothetical protein
MQVMLGNLGLQFRWFDDLVGCSIVLRLFVEHIVPTMLAQVRVMMVSCDVGLGVGVGLET